MRCQFVLDDHTNQLLEELAADQTGNRSFVVREAIQLYAAMESELTNVEADPAFLRMMAGSAADIQAGRVHPHSKVKRLLRGKTRKKRSGA